MATTFRSNIKSNPIRLNPELTWLLVTELCDDHISPQIWSEPGTSKNPRALSQYATVCKEWAAIVERYTFASIRVSSYNLPELGRLYHGHRRTHLRKITLLVEFPNLKTPAEYTFKSQSGRNLMDGFFIRAMKELFDILAVPSPNKCGNIELTVLSQRQEEYEHFISAKMRRKFRKVSRSRINMILAEPLVDSETLPVVAGIRSLRLDGNVLEEFGSVSISSILLRLPNLEKLLIEDEDDRTETYAFSRPQNAELFVNDILQWPGSIKYLKYRHEYSKLMPLTGSMVDRSVSYCHIEAQRYTIQFYSNLRHYSQSLTTLHLHLEAMIPDIFWSPQDSTATPHWPHLVNITFISPAIPRSGYWLMVHKSNKANTDMANSTPQESGLDGTPNKNVQRPTSPLTTYTFDPLASAPLSFDEFYLAAGKAASRMPMLQRFRIAIQTWSDKNMHFFEYMTFPRPTAEWTGLLVYTPSDEVVTAWKDAAGGELVVSLTRPEEKRRERAKKRWWIEGWISRFGDLESDSEDDDV